MTKLQWRLYRNRITNQYSYKFKKKKGKNTESEEKENRVESKPLCVDPFKQISGTFINPYHSELSFKLIHASNHLVFTSYCISLHNLKQQAIKKYILKPYSSQSTKSRMVTHLAEELLAMEKRNDT